MSDAVRFTEAIGVDVGSKRIGVARMNAIAKIAQPVATVKMDDAAAHTIKQIAQDEAADLVIVGVPLTQSGSDSQQTRYSRQFADTLKAIGLQVVEQDETLSTIAAENMLKDGRYSRNGQGQPASIDEVAACVILETYLQAIK